MDPVTAIVNLLTEVVKLIAQLSEGQPPEVKRQFWEWYVEDVKRWRKLLKIE